MPARQTQLLLPAILLFLLVTSRSGYCLDGHLQYGIGPINQSMGGAGTASFIDALGTLAWNPAGSVRFDNYRADFGAELLLPNVRLKSTARKDALTDFVPPFTVSGETSSRPTTAIQPAFAMTYHDPDSRWGFHLGALNWAVEQGDYPKEPLFTANSNFLLTEQPPEGLGLGRVEADYVLLTFPVGASYKLTDSLDIGASVIPAASWLKFNPGAFAAPDDANGDGIATYPTTEHRAYGAGIGFQLGVAWDPIESVTLGASMSTPTWFNDFKFKMKDENGGRRNESTNVDGPPVLSLGVAWRPWEKTVIASDFRVIFFNSVPPFKDVGINEDGSLRGFGWNNSMALGIGVQQGIGEKHKVRLGYHWVDSPVPERYTFFNIAAPLTTEHHGAIGYSYQLTERTQINVGAYHAFNRTIEGPIVLPAGSFPGATGGPIPGTTIKSKLSLTSISLGMSIDL